MKKPARVGFANRGKTMKGKVKALAFAVGLFIPMAPTLASPYDGEIVPCPGEYATVWCQAHIIQTRGDVPARFYERNKRNYNPSAEKPEEMRRFFMEAVTRLNPGINFRQMRPGTFIYVPTTVGVSVELAGRDRFEERLVLESGDYQLLYISESRHRDQLRADNELLRSALWTLLLLVAAFFFGTFIHYMMDQWRQAREKGGHGSTTSPWRIAG